MGKGLGVILLVIGVAIIYFQDQIMSYIGSNSGVYSLWIGIIFVVIGLGRVIFSRSGPRY